MKLVKELGFLAVVSYGGGVSGFDAYYQDRRAMSAAGFQDYASFVKAIYSQVQEHAGRNGWIPVYYNLADEPIGDDLVRAAENAEAYRRAFPKGPPYFTGASSFTGNDRAGSPLPPCEGPACGLLERPRRGVRAADSRRGRRLGFLQRRQPLDLRHLHVQGREAVRDEVPALLALERGGGRPVLCTGLPRRRLRLVQHLAGRGSSSRRSSSSGCGKASTIIGD